MAIHIDKVKNLRIIKNKFFTPVNKNNKRMNSLIFLLLPPNDGKLIYEFFCLKKDNKINNFMVNSNMFYSLYEERNVSYFITDKGLKTNSGEILENTENFCTQQQELLKENNGFLVTRDYFIYDDKINFFTENNIDNAIKRYLFKNRYKNLKELKNYYDEIKNNSLIKYTFDSIEKYKEKNLFVSMNRYMEALMTNKIDKKNSLKDLQIFFNILSRLFLDFRFNSYTKKSVIIPVNAWVQYLDIGSSPQIILNYKNKINPLNTILYYLKKKPEEINSWRNIDFIFIGNNGFFKYNFNEPNKIDINKFIICLSSLIKNTFIDDEQTQDIEDKKTDIIAKIEDKTDVKINYISGAKNKNFTDVKVSNKINDALDLIDNKNDDSIIDKLEQNLEFKNNLISLRMEEEARANKLSEERKKRFNELNNKFLKKQVNNKSIKELFEKETKLNEVSFKKVESIDETWDNLKKPNFEKDYSLDSDILKCIYSFSKNNKDVQMSVVDISKQDTSTTEDDIYTYKIVLEDSLNKRHTLTIDVPKIKDNRFLKLGGNNKILSGQLINLPIIKTDDDTVQVVSNYNKIFIRLKKSIGKSSQRVEAIIHCLKKIMETNYKDPDNPKYSEEINNRIRLITLGNNTKICKKYDLSVEYIDLAKFFNKIYIGSYTIYFNQDEFNKLERISDYDKFSCIAVKSIINKKEVRTENRDGIDYVTGILELLMRDPYFKKLYKSYFTTQKSAAYSEASILSSNIPLIIIMAYNVGLTEALKRSNINFNFQEKRPIKSLEFIKFKDGYLIYESTIENIILLNGLYKFNTEDYCIKEIDSKQMWLDALDLYGAKYKANGLDSFYNLMIDPITEDVCKHYNFPTEYIEVLAYANSLLVSNNFNRHVDINGNRFRTNERIAHFLYKALATSYGDYLREVKNNKKEAKMTIKKSAVIDLALQDSTMSDLSILTPLLELESSNTVTFKGLSGMNSDRSYQLDKRTYDESMLNKLAMSTGFAANVGINRQTTINMDIDDTKGYLYDKCDNLENVNDANTLSITEALTPMGTTHDDPMRTAMTFIQTAKHSMRTANSDPLLVSNGADQVLPYLTSDLFSFKAKEDGKVIKITDSYMEVQYKSGKKDYIDLSENIEKTSDGGFFIVVKLDPCISLGKTFKIGDVIAFDKLSFSEDVGVGNITYNIGKLSKIAIMCTDEGFEDSATVSEKLAKDLSSDVVVKIEALLDKNDKVIDYLKPGSNIIEGQEIFTYINEIDDPESIKILDKLIKDKTAVNSLGNINIKSKVTGVLQDIKVYSTVPTSEMSNSLKKFCEYVYDKENKFLKISKKPIPNRVLSPTGKLKNKEEKILIEFYLKYSDDLSVGDKIVFFSALKGTVKRIFPEGQEPRSLFRKNEIVSSLLPLSGVNARMVASVPILVALNKVIIELDRAVKDIYGIKYNDGL